MGNQPSYLGPEKIPITSLEAVANEWRIGEYDFSLNREAFTTLLSKGGLSLPVSASSVFDVYAIPTKPLSQVYWWRGYNIGGVASVCVCVRY